MSVARTQHSVTLLADGRVFVAAGSAKFDLSDVLGSLAQAHRSVEVYNPAADTWTSGPDIPIPGNGLVGQGASLLGNGQVLLTGGVEVSIVFGIPIPSFSANCHRFDPASGTWTPGTPDLPAKRTYHGQVALPGGSALVVGGVDGDFLLLSFNTLSGCVRYDPASNTWTSVAPLTRSRAYPNVIVAGNEVVVLGGLGTVDVASGTGTPEQVIEVAPATLLGWTTVAGMSLPREVARAAAIDGGERILIVGTGDNGVPTVDLTAEVYVR